MALRTRENYLESLRSLRPNIYKFGELIEDVTTHPATRRVVESHARGLEAAHNPDLADVFTTKSILTGEIIHRNNSIMATSEDMIANSKFKRKMYQLTGTCTGGLCAGWWGYHVLWAITYEMDQDLGTDYHQRLREWGKHFEGKGLVASGALTDAKGSRKIKPQDQPDPDVYLRVVEERDDGIVIRGAKLMICAVAAAEEIFLVPGTAYSEEGKQFAVSCVVPRDIEGLTIVETRRPSDTRDHESGFDNPLQTGITQSYLIFDNVFVPKERVFMCGEWKYTGKVVSLFTASYRACIGACVAGQGDVMVGASALMARANGLSAKTFRDKLTQMELLNETTFTMGVGAIAMGKQHPSGAWTGHALRSHCTKVQVGTLPYETKRLAQEIGGGIVETGCLPSSQDMENENYGELIKKYLNTGACPPEDRARIARLVEWLTIGGGVPGCMHGGGSPDGARLFVYALSPLNEYTKFVTGLIDLEKEIPEPK